MIWAAPDSNFVSTVQGAATGLVGTIGVRVIALPANTTAIARSTAGITESPAGSGIYAKSIPAPDAQGAYIVVWDDGTNFASEELTVTYDLPVPATPGGDIVSLAAYQEAMGTTTDPNSQQFALDAASAAVRTFTDRDFNTPVVTATKDYTYRGTGFLEIDDAVAVHSVTATFPIFNWYAHQDGPASANVFSWIELPKLDARNLESFGQMGFTRNLDRFFARGAYFPWEWTVSVNADFGWASVPADVQQAVIWLAKTYQDSTGSNQSGDVSSETVAEVSRSYVIQAPVQPSSIEDSGIPAKVQALLWPYKRHVL